VIAVMHDLTLAARHCDRLVLLDGGRVAAVGTVAEVLTEERIAKVYGVAAALGTASGGPYVLPFRRL
jgi:iron complex transport system ATP-binding protein